MPGGFVSDKNALHGAVRYPVQLHLFPKKRIRYPVKGITNAFFIILFLHGAVMRFHEPLTALFSCLEADISQKNRFYLMVMVAALEKT